jgi:hypothetical protein
MPYWTSSQRKCGAVDKLHDLCGADALPGSDPPRCPKHVGRRNLERVRSRLRALREQACSETGSLHLDAEREVEREKRRRWKRSYRAKWGVCTCAAYRFPHRPGGGRCQESRKDNAEAQPATNNS